MAILPVILELEVVRSPVVRGHIRFFEPRSSFTDGTVVVGRPRTIASRALIAHSHDKRIWRVAHNVDPNAFRLQVFSNRVDATFAPNSRTLVAAERRHVAHRPVSVHPNHSRFQLLGHQQGAPDAGGPNARGEAVIVIDSDLQDPPEVIPALAAAWRDGFDMVYAERRARDARRSPIPARSMRIRYPPRPAPLRSR